MNDSQRDFSCSSLSSSLNRKDIQFNNIELESSLESSSNFFDKNQHHFSTSSEISFINPNIERLDKNPLSTADCNRTFTKEIPRPIINIFTGKPIVQTHGVNCVQKIFNIYQLKNQIKTKNINLKIL
jgi:hypothetical protein